MLQVLTGGALGQVVAGNVGGFIVGSFILDVVKTAKIQYVDRQLENGDEAARRLKYNIKQAEETKPEEKKKAEEKQDKLKKAEELQKEDKKAEKKKEIDRKVEDKIRELEKKAEEQRKQDKKAEETRDFDKRASLIINDSTITPQITETGAKVEASVNYTLLGPETLKSFAITETRILTNRSKSFELDKRERSREQGTYSSTVKFTVSEDMPTGYCTLYTMISDGEYTKTVKSEVIINK
ncbi:MAG: hypothetical protein RDU01_03560 [Thermodesulfovibrionales bacterium]|nr:hypothetical protein [Thermodesulfovibrionales bacterium]